MAGYLKTKRAEECFGCEACVQRCAHGALHMREDAEGFRYPEIEAAKCVSCGACEAVCPQGDTLKHHDIQYAFGGYLKDSAERQNSTSGGAFSAIVNTWCDENSVIFGAAADGLEVVHGYCTETKEISRFQKSKYTQSRMGSAYADAEKFLKEGKKVLFSGTPCQIAGLKKFLGAEYRDTLLTVEVVCEGVPSPKFLLAHQKELQKQYGCGIRSLDYRNKDRPRWDFNVMKITLENGREIYIDRWFNPFFTIWIGGLMSRPSCYGCPFLAQTSPADISLGDLWGVHLYCPELYGENKGASLVLCHTEQGRAAFSAAQGQMLGHELDTDQVLLFQRRLRQSIPENPQRAEFMADLAKYSYRELCRKWAAPPTLRLLWSKYVWGNRQKIWLWALKNKLRQGVD